MKQIKLSNFWKARISTMLGLAVPVIAGITTDLSTGSVNWATVKLSLVASVGLFVTDLLKETQKELTNPTDEATK